MMWVRLLWLGKEYGKPQGVRCAREQSANTRKYVSVSRKMQGQNEEVVDHGICACFGNVALGIEAPPQPKAQPFWSQQVMRTT